MVARSRLVTLAEQLFTGRGKACNRASILRPSSTPFGALRAQWTQWAQLNTPSRARRTVRGAATGHPVPDASGTLNLTGKPAFIEEFGGPARRRPGAIRVLQDGSKGGSTARATAKRALNGGTRSPPQLGSHPSKGLLWSRPGASGGARRRACSALRFRQRLPTELGPFQAPCVSSHSRARTTPVPNVHPGSLHGCGGSLHPGRPRCRAPTASRASRTV